MTQQHAHQRTVFFVSDGTGITAETFGNAILNQFEFQQPLRHVRLPFVSDMDKARQAVQQINQTADAEGKRPIVFSTLVNDDILWLIKTECRAMVLDMFGTIVQPLEIELGIKSHHRIGRFSDPAKSDVILVGVSRSGQTPTSLYLSMQDGLKVANYPLIPEDFDRQQLPEALMPYKHKLFGLSIQPERLSEIRNERRPGSKYASLENCRHEIGEAEAMMRRSGVQWLSTTSKSIEEIATTILQHIQPELLDY